jgi:hypothetical protein
MHSSFSVSGISRAEACLLIPAFGSDARIRVQRSTMHCTLRSFEQEPVDAEPGWNPDRFGSSGQLAASQEFRFWDRREDRS